MKTILSALIFILSGCAAFSILGAGAVYLAASGALPDTAAGHYMMSAVYFMMCGSLILSVAGMIVGFLGAVVGFCLASRLRTLISAGLGIISGAIWIYLLNCGV